MKSACLLAFILVLFTYSSCSKDGSSNINDCSNIKNVIIGSWTFDREIFGSKKSGKLEFFSDGSFISIPENLISGTIEINGQTLPIISRTYTISNNTIILSTKTTVSTSTDKLIYERFTCSEIIFDNQPGILSITLKK